jgi:adenosylmethionine-8-amino-7-oxononanoate aminotransferase
LGEASITGNLARAEIVPELDRLARAADDETLAKLADELEKVARTEKPEAIAAFVMGQ